MMAQTHFGSREYYEHYEAGDKYFTLNVFEHQNYNGSSYQYPIPFE